MRVLLLALLLSGCSVLEKRETVATCVAADVATTVIGVKMGAMREINPLWAKTVNAHKFLPFILTNVLVVYLLWKWNQPVVNAVESTVACGLAVNNALLILR